MNWYTPTSSIMLQASTTVSCITSRPRRSLAINRCKWWWTLKTSHTDASTVRRRMRYIHSIAKVKHLEFPSKKCLRLKIRISKTIGWSKSLIEILVKCTWWMRRPWLHDHQVKSSSSSKKPILSPWRRSGSITMYWTSELQVSTSSKETSVSKLRQIRRSISSWSTRGHLCQLWKT